MSHERLAWLWDTLGWPVYPPEPVSVGAARARFPGVLMPDIHPHP
ncbi:hypothetical protein [Actinophytocola sediminis]